MLSRSFIEQVKCRWREFRREPSAFFWVVFMPVVWMLVLGFAFSKPHPETYGIGWLPTAANPWVEDISKLLHSHPQLKVRDGDDESLQTKMKRGEISLILSTASQDDVKYRLDPSSPEAVRAQKFVDDLIQRHAGRQDVVRQEMQAIEVEGGRYVDFLIPGLLGLSIMTSSLFGVGMTIVSNRKENLLKRYLATPMRAYEYIVSHMVGRGIVLIVEFIAVALTGMLIFHFKVHGGFGAYFVFAAVGAAAFTGIALLCAARTRSLPMIAGLTNLITLSMMMLSGVFFSRNNFPDWLVQLSNFLPLTALNDGLRKIALEGQSLTALGFELGVLGVYLIVSAVAANRLFKWY